MNFRHLRMHKGVRDLVRESGFSVNDLIMPIFIREGIEKKQPISSMPGIYQVPESDLLDEVREIKALGIKAILLFGIPLLKDSIGSDALNEEGLISRSIRSIKAHFKEEIVVISDLCFCEYTDHGHCGIINPKKKTVDNEATLGISADQALIHAKAGVDMIAPSGMMDDIIKTLRSALDENGYDHVSLMSYSTKFASSFYGPFREAAGSTPMSGDYIPKDRQTYQMDVANKNEALRESIEDMKQGADILMVKPALSFLDIVVKIKEETKMPLCVYNVSGEYSMIKAAANAGFLDYNSTIKEVLTSFKRAGADMIITYHAKDAAKLLKEENGY